MLPVTEGYLCCVSGEILSGTTSRLHLQFHCRRVIDVDRSYSCQHSIQQWLNRPVEVKDPMGIQRVIQVLVKAISALKTVRPSWKFGRKRQCYGDRQMIDGQNVVDLYSLAPEQRKNFSKWPETVFKRFTGPCYLLQYMVREIDRKPALDGSSLLKSITILDAIYWINSSWQEIETETISKCFAKAGFVFNSHDVAITGVCSDDNGDGNSDDDEDDNIPLAVLRASRELLGCPFNDLASIDQHVATCNTNSVDWDQPVEHLLEELKAESRATCNSESDTSDSEEDCERVLTFSDACAHVERLKLYAKRTGHSTLLQMFVRADEELSKNAVNSQKQCKISDFFQSRNVC